MTRYHLINGKQVAFTAEEETARDAEEARLTAKEAATEYKENRICGIGTTISGYGSIGEQLDMQYWDAVNGTTTWKDHVAAVKAKYPKPS